jgi:hypothetical protein
MVMAVWKYLHVLGHQFVLCSELIVMRSYAMVEGM